MLGESPEQEDRRERHALWQDLLALAMPPQLIRFRLDVAQRELDRLIAGPPPKVSRWNHYSARRQLAYWMWKTLLAIQTQRRLLKVSAA